MTNHERKLILITGIPGTGKTYYEKRFAEKFGFKHFDLENIDVLQRLVTAPSKFVADLLKNEGDIVATWGFVPNDHQIGIVHQFIAKGFKLVWFDGNRPAALREFIK